MQQKRAKHGRCDGLRGRKVYENVLRGKTHSKRLNKKSGVELTGQ